MAEPANTTSTPASPSAADFFQSATGHAIIGLLISAASSVLLALVNDANLAQDLGVGGSLATLIKLVVDIIRPGIANI